jgi:predicted dehydrogenase
MKTYRVGIVGTGFGVSGHLPALRNHPRFEVVALASPSSAERIARDVNVPHAFRSCAEMLAGCDLDAVTVASPPFAHLEDVLVTLAARKHLIVEKPFALRVADAREMVEASKAAGVTCGIAHEFRFVPQAIALKELVVNRHLGALRDIEITLLRSNLRADVRAPRSWWFDRERGGGVAGALLSHLIDLSTWLAGSAPLRVVGFRRTANRHRFDDKGRFESTVDDGAFALIEYPAGLAARLCADSTTAVESYTGAVHGERRTAVASGQTITSVTLYTVDAQQTDELECKASPYHRLATINPNVPLLMELYDEFARAIEGKPNMLPTFDEELHTQEALAAIGYDLPTGSG